MVLVAAAGPAMNIALAVVAALAFHLVGYLPVTAARWLANNLKNALILNVVLCSIYFRCHLWMEDAYWWGSCQQQLLRLLPDLSHTDW